MANLCGWSYRQRSWRNCSSWGTALKSIRTSATGWWPGRRLRTQVIGREVLVFEETTSTNDVVERLAQSQPQEGLVVFAESQTKGRGRQARPWVSPRGKGLWLSI